MRVLTIVAAGLALAAFSFVPGIASLDWLSGSWVAQTDDRWTEESWTSPRGGTMLGSGRSGRGGELRDWEFMRIVADGDGRLVFYGSPKGAPAVAFPLASQSAHEVVFENRTHDFPQRISYRREGRELVATVSAADGTKAMSWRYRRR